MDDAHCGVAQGDVDNLEGAVSVEKQPRGTVARVAGEVVEPRPVAAGVPKAEGVRHAHVAAASAAVGHPCRRHRSHRRRQRVCCK